MNISFNSEKDFTEALKNCKKLSENPENHANLLKDKTVILFTASLLELNKLSVTNLCLDILDDLVENTETHAALMMTFGIFEALESTSIRLREIDAEQAHRASAMADVLRRNAPPAYSTKMRTRRGQQRKSVTTMYQLYIPLLTPETRHKLEDTLLKVKGLVSFIMDTEQQKCTLRLSAKLTINSIIRAIFDETEMKAFLVIKNRNDINEVYIDIFNESNNKYNPEYLSEDDTPPKGKSLADLKNVTNNAGGWIKSVAGFFSDSFYW